MSFSRWFDHHQVTLHRHNTGAYTYITSRMALDADGSPRAYHPNNTGLDALGNAGYPNGNWRAILVVDPQDNSRPFVQPGGPNAGNFVSKTSLQDLTRVDTDPARYVDSERIPYLVFPGQFYRMKGTGAYGDLAMARNVDTGDESYAIVADGGPSDHALGEVSLALATNLGGTNPNPRNGRGMPRGRFQYMLFPRSRTKPAWPRSEDDMRTSAETLLADVGGWPVI